VTPVIAPGPRAAATRRTLGPVAWCVLACLVERSADGRTSSASVRSIAADLGVAKNTAHRAIARLVRAGLAEAVQERDARGWFRPGRYRLNVTDLLPAAPTPIPRRPRPRAARRSAPSQLSLLDRS
jgi:DNA-binding IclR family transcriptional regulator